MLRRFVIFAKIRVSTCHLVVREKFSIFVCNDIVRFCGEHIVFAINIYLVVSQKLIISCKRIRILETGSRKNRFIKIGSRIAEELGIETTDKLLTIRCSLATPFVFFL